MLASISPERENFDTEFCFSAKFSGLRKRYDENERALTVMRGMFAGKAISGIVGEARISMIDGEFRDT